MNKYDVAIIGSGPSAIFAAYELVVTCPSARVIILEAGSDIYSRKCPIAEKKSSRCVKCNPCDIMRGFGGAGAFSDGKYNFTTEFGGWLQEYLPAQDVMDLIEYVDRINLHYGAPSDLFSTEKSTIGKKALAHDLHLLHAKVRHLGTENNLQILKNLFEYLHKKVTLLFRTPVSAIIPNEKSFLLDIGKPEKIECDYLIAAPGRAGSEWFASQCKHLSLSLFNNQVDVGVRVEIPAEVFQHITDEVYEAKLVYRTKQYGDLVRTFCMNPYGYVVAENTDGIITVNGHSYRDEKLHSRNTNFALLVSNRFTEPFNEPHQYGKRIASFSNLLGGGVLVQRFGDLVKGRRTNEHRLAQSFTKPTLKAVPGDLSLVLPKRHLDNIVEMIYALDKIAPGMANNDTLLYGVEVKFYSSRLKLTHQLETQIANMFAIGDGAGVTRGLSQASASGVHVARVIAARLQR
ncbi:fad dependent oxidoreductase, putative [Heliomicrobium modesticaldum Ice1]|uniref:Fad dependent oxidoreductase, putative n=1 Tax=Heliobacterium modesticaldum (strain ATCC 51547 / Ice1) TaxID=498761 RepID=B0TFT5_HELMI|nr:NAD(P)/FAD-dependent oxidoreductase [Heliomicrobium modesticaldum]ABZ84515.1 fad dependent oxidoreductase, putative [Heliomicrobium modesticaldum Ice1]